MHRAASALWILVLLMPVGCASIARLDITVQLDTKEIAETGTVPTIEVNLVGVNEAEYPQWQGYSIDQYWSAEDKLRKGADRYIMRFSETQQITQTLPDDASVWDGWEEKTVKYLFVLADIPGLSGGKGGKDGRLLVLPLSPDAWSADQVYITIKSGGITCTPSPRIEKD
jgi:hypothetical protein